MTDAQRRLAIQAYRASISFLDAQVGRVAVPGSTSAGSTAPGVVELVDLYPTLTDLCGLKPPEYVEGTSLRPAIEDPEHRIKEAAYTQVDRGESQGRSVRTERWRYTEWDDGKKGVELYDYEREALEAQNLAADPAQAAEVARLKVLLDAVRRREAPKAEK